MTNWDAIRQLRAVREDVLAIAASLDDADPCIESIRRIQAAQSALRATALDLLERHLASCVASAVDENDNCQQTLADIQAAFCWANNVNSTN